ncbi:MAG: hypothetical protein GY950_34335 [bacterium]|nr:hypothetical protein [bacterium]
MSENTPPAGNSSDNAAASGAAASGNRKKKKNQSFERELIRIGRGIDLTLTDPVLKDYASGYGYNRKRVKGLKALFDETRSAYESQKEAQAKQRAATRLFMETRNKADATIRRLLETARLAFRNNPDAYDALGLKGARKRAFGEWVSENKLLYKNFAVPGIVAKMTNYNVTPEGLAAGKQELMDTITADIAQENLKAEAQKATALKNKAWGKLKRAWRKYLIIMKEALEDDPQMKEKLGIVVPFDPNP